ncbi:hypothetical protein ScPMuIL_000638 [Solemya velum]
MASSIIDTDSEDELPAGWEERVTLDGKVFYANHDTRVTQWTHPLTKKKKIVRGELPYGWERRLKEDGIVYYVDTINKKTTYTDPRLAFADNVKESPYDFKQKFDGNSTALQVLQGRDLTGQYFIVTGASSGIGYETTRSLLLHGASITMACRNLELAKTCRAQIMRERPEADVEVMHLDLSSLRSVKSFAEEYIGKKRPLHALILNAGQFGIAYNQTEDGIEEIFQVNHLSHFYLTTLLKDVLISSAPARVVVVSSESHRYTDLCLENLSEEKLSPPQSKYSDMKAYNLSKLCNVLFMREFHKQLSPLKVTSLAVHPGNMVSTRLQRSWWLYKLVFILARPFTKSLQQAAATTVYCAVSPDLNNIEDGECQFNKQTGSCNLTAGKKDTACTEIRGSGKGTVTKQ